MKESASSIGNGRLRRLSAEEIELWLAVARTVNARPSSVLPQAPAPAAGNGAAPASLAAPPAPAAARPAAHARIPPLAPLDRKLRQKLSRGRMAPDAAIDLHGLTRQEAFEALHRFLAQAHREGARLVLVVTGKGGRSNGEVQGVLRRHVPHWLSGPDFRSIIIGFEEASRPHGGAGALYVRLKRRGPLQD